MSLIRLSRPGYPTTLIDQGPSRAHASTRFGIQGGGPPIVQVDGYVKGESAKTVAERSRREYNARRDVEAKAAADHDYYLRNKARLRGEALLERVRKP